MDYFPRVNVRLWVKIIFFTFAIVGIAEYLCGCTTTKKEIVYVPKVTVLVPSKIAVPELTTLQKYDTKKDIMQPANFRKLQENSLALTDYVISLRSTIQYYEDQIDEMTQKKQELESTTEVATDPAETK